MPNGALQKLWQHFTPIKAEPNGWIRFHWSWSRSKGRVCGARGGAASLSPVPWLVPAESSCPQRPLQTVFLCASVNESRLGWSVSEWRGGEFSREDCAGQRVVSIIQGKHWAAWLHALDVTKAGRTEMDETMRLPLACMSARLRLPPALPHFLLFLSPPPPVS